MSTDIPAELVDEIKQHWEATPELQKEAWDWCRSGANHQVRVARAAAILDLYNEVGMCRSQIRHPQLFAAARSGAQAHPAAFEINRRPAGMPVPLAPIEATALLERGSSGGLFR